MMRSTNRPTAVATRQFFEFLETKYGGLPLFRLPRENGALPPKVAKRSRLELKDLQDLLAHKHLALHITNFYPRESAIKLGLQIAESVAANKNKTDSPLHNWKVSTAKGLESSDVFTMGKHQPWNMAISSPNMVEEYLMQVPLEFRHRRRHDNDNNIAKVLWPLDQLRLELDEIWPAGSNVSRSKSGKCMGGGLPRIMMGPTRWKKGLIHVDELGPLKLEEGCFSANIYLQLPSDDVNDPVMEIWPLDVRSRWDWYRNAHTLSELTSQSAEGQVRLRHLLGEPERIAVQPGDLVLLCVQRPHCAIGFSNPKIRVSLQTFLQYSGAKEGLRIES